MILAKTDEFEIRGEFLWFGLILHGDVLVPWNRGVKKKVCTAIREIVEVSPWPCWAFHIPSYHAPKQRKFIQVTGGVFHHFRWTPEGERAEFYLYRPLDLSKGKQHG